MGHPQDERRREGQLQGQGDQLGQGHRGRRLRVHQGEVPVVLLLPGKDQHHLARQGEVDQREALESRRKIRWSDGCTLWWSQGKAEKARDQTMVVMVVCVE